MNWMIMKIVKWVCNLLGFKVILYKATSENTYFSGDKYLIDRFKFNNFLVRNSLQKND